MRKSDGIDLMKLYSVGNDKAWNAMLTDCFNKYDINRLAKIKYQISVGMADLAKLKLNDDKMNEWFLRLMRSLEITAKRIIKKKHPMPGDNMSLIQSQEIDSIVKKKMLVAKRKRDDELKKFLKDSSF
jgi:hypothetical protein